MIITTIAGINFAELATSRETTKSDTVRSIPLKFIAYHTNNQVLLEASFETLVGTSFNGIPLEETHCLPLGGGVWNCEALFSFKTPVDAANQTNDEVLGPAFAVDLSAGTTHITQSLETLSTVSGGVNLRIDSSDATKVYPGTGVSADDGGKTLTITGGTGWTVGDYFIVSADTTAGSWTVTPSPGAVGITGGEWMAATGPNFQQAIGVTKDGVAGTDVFTPRFELSITVKTPDVTLDFLRVLAAAGATVNDAEWKGFEAGTVLYLGATGQYQPGDYFSFTHKFSVGRNLTDFAVTPNITLDKGAWDYLWCTYGRREVAGLALQVPQTAYVEKVYQASDFNLLRLNPPVADFTSSPIGGISPLGVTFADLSTGTPLTWAWTFGDGNTSTLRNPSNIYLLPGVYTVSLTVTNGAGTDSETKVNFITVS